MGRGHRLSRWGSAHVLTDPQHPGQATVAETEQRVTKAAALSSTHTQNMHTKAHTAHMYRYMNTETQIHAHVHTHLNTQIYRYEDTQIYT